jgi:hypothetical protein
LLLALGGCHRAEIELTIDETEPAGGAPPTQEPLAGAGSVFPPQFMGVVPNSAVDLERDQTPSTLAQCLQPLEAEQAECLFLGNGVCQERPLAGELRACVGPCAACRSALADYPFYFAWHPCCEPESCDANDELSACDARCPPPTEHDKIAPCSLPDGAD